jgi:NitT/TauT family transport system substrate-binding protein
VKLIGALSLTLVALLFVDAPSALMAQSPDKITIAVLPSDSVRMAYYAIDRGSFKRAGLDAQLVSLQSGPAIAAAVASGAADFGAANIIALAVAHEKGLPFIAIAPAGVYTEHVVTQALVVEQSSKMKTAKDLVDRVIGVDSLKTLATIAISSWVDRNGGDSTTLKFIEIPFAQMGMALAAGRVDAAFIPEPVLSGVLNSGGRVLSAPLNAIGPELQLGAWFTTADYAKTHADLIRRFVLALAENVSLANSSKNTNAAIFEKYTGIQAHENTQWMVQADRVNLATVQPLIDAATKYGVLKRTFPASELYAAPR